MLRMVPNSLKTNETITCVRFFFIFSFLLSKSCVSLPPLCYTAYGFASLALLLIKCVLGDWFNLDSLISGLVIASCLAND